MPSQLRRSRSLLTPTAASSAWTGSALPYGVLVLTVWSLLLGAAALLLSRRLAGAFDSPLSMAGLAISGLVLAILAHLARASLPGEFSVRRRTGRHVVAISAGLGVAAAGAIAVSLPGSSPLGLGLLWTPLLVEGLAIVSDLSRQTSGATRFSLARLLTTLSREVRPGRQRPTVPRRPLVPPAVRSQQRESQSLVRIESGDADSWRGRVLVHLPSGRRTASAHIAFCPPFAETPTVRIKVRPGPEMDVSVGQILPHGVRFDVKLPQNAVRSLAVPIEFHARGPATETS